MRKYVVPIAALAGIALLSSSANAAELILKSRAIPVGKAGSVPVIVRNVGNGGSLWGIDAGLSFGSANVAAVDANNAFTATTGYDSAKDVIVTGVPSVGGGTQPGLYFGYVKGGAGISAASATTQVGVGLVKLKVTGGALKDVYTITTPDYNVKNDGTGNAVSRKGATAATVAGTTVSSETVTLFDGYLSGNAPAAGNPDLRVPTHRVAVGAPGDVTGDGAIGSADLSNLAAVLVNKAASSWTEYKRIASDIAPPNGYAPGNVAGNGLSYGDGVVGSGDLGLLAAKLVSKPAASVFPVPE